MGLYRQGMFSNTGKWEGLFQTQVVVFKTEWNVVAYDLWYQQKNATEVPKLMGDKNLEKIKAINSFFY